MEIFSMNCLILSDLHLEFHDFTPPAVAADIVILAGDLDIGTSGVSWAMKAFPKIPVLYINGNHEFYHNNFPGLIASQKMITSGSNVHILDKEFFDYGDVRFFGCTLWTDFALYGNPAIAMREASFEMPDFRITRNEPEKRILCPLDTVLEFNKSVTWLKQQLSTSNRKNVIITHHLPLVNSIGPEFENSTLNPAFASDLHNLINTGSPSIWVHGHTHRPCDYIYGKTRIICNPRGYPNEKKNGFKPALTVTI
jgi:predicted phosphodiesterase